MSKASSSNRKRREREHFDRVYDVEVDERDLRVPAGEVRRYGRCAHWRIYGKECAFKLGQPLAGREVLEVGCGTGTDTVLLAANGARVFAYDLSERAIDVARRRARVNGVADRTHFRVADGPLQAFPGQRFDLVWGNAILHHLDLTGLAEQFLAVLNPNGACVFREPVIFDSWLGRLRRCIPWYPSRPSPDERPLDALALKRLSECFAGLELHEFECFSRLWPVFRSGFVIAALHEWDARMFRRLPWTRRFASVAVIRMTKNSNGRERRKDPHEQNAPVRP